MNEPIILNYKEYPLNKLGDGGKIYSKKPLIEISPEKFPNRKITCLLDSGADTSISFKAIGETYFGLIFVPSDKIENNVSGLHTCPDFNCSRHPQKAPLYLKPITFLINGKKVQLNVRWLDRGFNPQEDFLFILGRDFFWYFDVMFKQQEQKCYLYWNDNSSLL